MMSISKLSSHGVMLQRNNSLTFHFSSSYIQYQDEQLYTVIQEQCCFFIYISATPEDADFFPWDVKLQPQLYVAKCIFSLSVKPLLEAETRCFKNYKEFRVNLPPLFWLRCTVLRGRQLQQTKSHSQFCRIMRPLLINTPPLQLNKAFHFAWPAMCTPKEVSGRPRHLSQTAESLLQSAAASPKRSAGFSTHRLLQKMLHPAFTKGPCLSCLILFDPPSPPLSPSQHF